MSSESLKFISSYDYNVKTKKKLFIIYSHTNKAETSSYRTTFDDIKDVYKYIIKRYKDKSDSVISRRIKTLDGNFNFIIIRQETHYKTYISWKDYEVYSPDESEIDELRNLIHEGSFK